MMCRCGLISFKPDCFDKRGLIPRGLRQEKLFLRFMYLMASQAAAELRISPEFEPRLFTLLDPHQTEINLIKGLSDKERPGCSSRDLKMNGLCLRRPLTILRRE